MHGRKPWRPAEIWGSRQRKRPGEFAGRPSGRLRCRLAGLVALGMGVLLATLGCAESAQAGLYSTVEPAFPLSKDFKIFREQSLIPLRQIGTTEAKQPWQKSYMLTGDLFAELTQVPQKMTQSDRLNIATCLIRLRKFDDAALILEEVARNQRDSFLLWSTLGTAYMLSGKNHLAVEQLAVAAPFWSGGFAALSKEQQKFLGDEFGWAGDHPFPWYARCEKIQYRLAKLRRQELGASKKLSLDQALTKLDDLCLLANEPKGFQPARFVGPSGAFEVKKIAAAEMEKLPPDAVEVVEQLLVWMPEDVRLIRLLGELLNANGDWEHAKALFGELFQKFVTSKAGQFGVASDEKSKLAEHERWWPVFVKEFPDVGKRLEALNNYVEVPESPPEAKGAPTGAKKPAVVNDSRAGTINIDVQTLAVGFGGGALVGIFGTWQLREILRRRQTRAAQRAGSP